MEHFFYNQIGDREDKDMCKGMTQKGDSSLDLNDSL